jgi:hypothetical protein
MDKMISYPINVHEYPDHVLPTWPERALELLFRATKFERLDQRLNCRTRRAVSDAVNARLARSPTAALKSSNEGLSARRYFDMLSLHVKSDAAKGFDVRRA